MKAQCWVKDKAANLVVEVEVNHLFMADGGSLEEQGCVWLIDSGCSNHMTGIKSLFQELDETVHQILRLGDNNEMKVAGVGTVALRTSSRRLRIIEQVQYVPNLAHNL